MSDHGEQAVVAAKRAVVFAAITFGANVVALAALVWGMLR